jgi:hypothetical protein
LGDRRATTGPAHDEETIAIGLAVVDLTFLATERVIDRLPEMTRVVYLGEPAMSAIPAGEQRFP